MTTIRDVARRASVSPATVSLVLQDAATVRPSTRDRVREAIDELGYKRRSVGRPPHQRRGLHVGVVYTGASVYTEQQVRNSATRRWFDAIREELTRRGHHVAFFGKESTTELGELFRAVVRQREVDSVIFIGAAAIPEHIQWVADQGIAVFVVNRRPRRDEFSYIDIDNYNGGRQAAEYLVGCGHRRLAVVRQDLTLQHNLDRLAGFKDGLQAHGLEPVLVCQRLYDVDNPRDFEDTCRQVLKAEATAVFCDGDSLAINCINGWQPMNIRVPEQISVIGFDDNGMVTNSGLRLTSIGFCSRTVGTYTVELMHRAVRHGDYLQNLSATVRTTVVEYDTVRDMADSAQTA